MLHDDCMPLREVLRYSLGQWYFNRQVVMEQIVQLLIDKGVDVAHVVENVERYALELEAQARGRN